MPRFICPNCKKHSNKFYSKCPECGFMRMEGKEIKVDTTETEVVTNIREFKIQQKLANDKFRGGRNKVITGADDKK